MKRSIFISGSIVVVVVALAALGTLAAQMFVGPDEVAADSPQENTHIIKLVRDEGDGPISLTITIEPAPELPDRTPDQAGVLVGQEDNMVSIGTGQIEADISVKVVKGQEPEHSLSVTHSGPVVQVKITDDTVIYQDVTQLNLKPGEDLNGEITVQQEVEAVSSLEGLGNQGEIKVWGHQQDDQLVADVLVFRRPYVALSPPGEK